MLERLPDLAAPIAFAGGPAYRAFDRTGDVVALPQRLLLDREPGGRPVLRVTLVRDSGSPGSAGGRLDLGLLVHTDFDGLGGELIARQEHATLRGVEVDGGVLRVTGSSEFTHIMTTGPDVLARAYLGVELGSLAATIAKTVTREGLPPVDARLRLRVRVVPKRYPVSYRFDPRAVADALADHFGAGASVTVAALAKRIEGALGGEPADTDGRGHALAMRVLPVFTEPEPTLEPLYRLRPPADVPHGDVQLDLAAPAVAAMDHEVRLDIGAATAAIVAADPGTLVRQVEIPRLPIGRTPVAVHANLVAPVVGMVRLLADVRVPARPPLRPQPVSASVELPAPDYHGEAVLTLAPDEELDGEVRFRALLDTGNGPEELTAPWRPCSTEHVLLAPDAFPLPTTVLRCTAALTALSEVDILAGDGRLLHTLDATHPSASVPIPGVRPRLRLRPRGDGTPIEFELPERARLDLDPATLPGFGVHHATFQLGTGGARTAVLWRPEGTPESEAHEIVLAPGNPSVRVRWVATSPFQPGLLWRPGTPGSPWSGPIHPADELVITLADAPIEIDGLELRADRGQAGLWTYLPPGPFLERGPSGGPALSVVDTGDVAFLQLTTRLDLAEEGRGRLTERLRQRLSRPGAEARAAPVVVETVGLQLVAEDGSWHTVASGSSSGLPPWTTALSATLTAAQLSSVKAAMGGRTGRARLHTRFGVPATPPRHSTHLAVSELAVRDEHGAEEAASVAVASSGPPAQEPRVIEQTNDLADVIDSP